MRLSHTTRHLAGLPRVGRDAVQRDAGGGERTVGTQLQVSARGPNKSKVRVTREDSAQNCTGRAYSWKTRNMG